MMRVPTRSILISVIVVAVCAAWAYRHGPRLLRRFETPAELVPPPAGLSEIVAVDGDEISLSDLIAKLQQQHGLTIELDTAEIEAADRRVAFDPTQPVSLDTGTRVSDVLNVLTRPPWNLGIELADGIVRITSLEEAESRLVTRVYPIVDYLGSTREVDSKRLGELLKSIIEPESWDDLGGPAELIAVPGALVVSQTLLPHRHIEVLLAALANDHDDFSPRPAYPNEHRATHDEIYNRLLKPTNVHFDSTPLRDVLTWFAKEFDIPCRIDEGEFKDFGVDIELPVSIDLRQVSGASALEHILATFGLSYMLREGVLLVTVREVSESQLNTVIYPVGDLLAWLQGDTDSLVEALSKHVEPERWEGVGGPGAIEPYGRDLIISQTQPVHRDVARFLGQLRRAVLPTIAASEASRDTQRALRKRLDETLKQDVTLDLPAQRLSTFIDKLSKQFDIPIRVDVRELEDFGHSPDSVVSIERAQQPLISVIQSAIAPLDLTTVREKELLVVTTGDAADYYYEELAFFPSSDFVPSHLRGDPDPPSPAQALIDLAEVTTASVTMLNDVLIISAPQDVLAAYRELREELAGRDGSEHRLWVNSPSHFRVHDVAQLRAAFESAAQTRDDGGHWYKRSLQRRTRDEDGLVGGIVEEQLSDFFQFYTWPNDQVSWYSFGIVGDTLIAYVDEAGNKQVGGVLAAMNGALNTDAAKDEIEVVFAQPSDGRRANGRPRRHFVRVYRLEPLLRRYPDVSADALADLVNEALTARPSRHAYSGMPDFRVHCSSLLSARVDEQLHDAIAQLLHYLAFEFPNPELLGRLHIARGGGGAAPQAESLADLLTLLDHDEPSVRAVAAVLLGWVANLPRDAVTALTQRFDSESDHRVKLLLLVALGDDGPLEADSQDAFETARKPLENSDSYHTAVSNLCQSDDGREVLDMMLRIPWMMSTEDVLTMIDDCPRDGLELAEPILAWLDSGRGHDLERMNERYFTPQPNIDHWQRVVKDWQASDDPVDRDYAEQLKRRLERDGAN